MTPATLSTAYASRYRTDSRTALYPVEFVVRAFLGTYPGLRMPKGRYAGRRVLDLGYGDGRNLPLFRDLGMKLHGVEIADAINAQAARRLKRLGIQADLRTGRCAQIPFPDGYFHFVTACHSCYYMDPGGTFESHLQEIARVSAPGAVAVVSLVSPGSFILKNARRLSGGYRRITRDPYGLRKGCVFRVFASEKEIRRAFGPFFRDIRIGHCDDDYWGIRQKVWVVVCRKRV